MLPHRSGQRTTPLPCDHQPTEAGSGTSGNCEPLAISLRAIKAIGAGSRSETRPESSDGHSPNVTSPVAELGQVKGHECALITQVTFDWPRYQPVTPS